MTYEVKHRTIYEYEQPVSLSYHVARLAPRALSRQICFEHQLAPSPAPAASHSHLDHFGNSTQFLTIEGRHRRLEIAARSVVEVIPPPAALANTSSSPW